VTREEEAWGGDVRLPLWLKRLLRRTDGPGDTPERAHERRKGESSSKSVAANADRAAVGILSDLYREGRQKRP
jgi:hypothetical protein